MHSDAAQVFAVVGVGLILSPSYGVGLWLKWQQMKVVV